MEMKLIRETVDHFSVIVQNLHTGRFTKLAGKCWRVIGGKNTPLNEKIWIFPPLI